MHLFPCCRNPLKLAVPAASPAPGRPCVGRGGGTTLEYVRWCVTSDRVGIDQATTRLGPQVHTQSLCRYSGTRCKTTDATACHRWPVISFFIDRHYAELFTTHRLGRRAVSVLDSGAEGPGFKSQSRRCRVTVLGRLFTPIVHQTAKLVAALLRVAGVTEGLSESNGSLPPDLWLTSPAGWLPRTGISSGTLRSVIEYGLALPFLQSITTLWPPSLIRK